MKYAFLLHKGHLGLARGEILGLVGRKNHNIDSNLMIFDSNKKEVNLLGDRLAFTKGIFRVIFECDEANITEKIISYNWNRIIKDRYAVRKEGKTQFKERGLAKLIWNKVKGKQVDLKNPESEIIMFFIKGKVYCCLSYKRIDKDFSERNPNKRPEFHPSSLTPRFARLLINLSSIKGGNLVDLMCGSGGILIEAGVMGLKPIGYDIDKIMINRSRINLAYYDIKNFRLEEKDALNVNNGVKYVVTDMPYGKNTKNIDMRNLYNGFLSNLRKILVKRAVLVFPIFKKKKNIDYVKLINGNGFKIVDKFDYPVHASLSRQIYVLEKN